MRLFIQRFLPACRFGCVGVLGLLVDIASVHLLMHLVGIWWALLWAYPIAATATWLCHRYWTFRHHVSDRHWSVQWIQFLASNSVGFGCNRGAVYAICWLIPWLQVHPSLAVCIGSLTGFGINFLVSSRWVFRSPSVLP